MNLARLGPVGAEFPVIQQDGVSYDLRTLTAELDGAFLADDGVGRARAALAAGELERVEDVDALRVGSPIARPGKIVCIGLNYRDHAEETNAQIPGEPVVFMKDPSTLVGPYDDVLIPRGSVKTDWEVELGVVIGNTARYLESDADALACIAGYVDLERRLGARVPARTRRPVGQGQELRDLQPVRPVARAGRRGARPAGARPAALGQRRAEAGRLDREHDLPGRPRHPVSRRSSWC